jgi:hypothetical protein
MESVNVFDRRPIIGHIRFSYYGFTDTRLRPDSEDDPLARLYGEARMARRFHLFENLTLPSLLAQTDKDFRIVVMSSDVMPDVYKDRLRVVTAGLPDVVLDFSANRQGNKAFIPHMNASLGPTKAGISTHFRLDDDDALAHTYIARLRQLTHTLPPSTHVSFPTGLILFPANPGQPDGISTVHQRILTSQGLATVVGPSFMKNPFMMMHSNVWTRWPLVSDPSFVAYIRTLHFENDTLARQDKVTSDIRRERTSRRAQRYVDQVDAALAAHFPFISQQRLNSLLAENHMTRSLADLPPPAG